MNKAKKGKDTVVDKMKKQIEEQIDSPPSEVNELIFQKIPIQSFTPEIQALLAQYPKLQSLEFNDCQLKTLDNFPPSNEIIKLCFEENQLDGKAIEYLVNNFPSLQFLSLSSNKISSLDDLKPLGRLKNPVQLDFQLNPVADLKDYRTYLFNLCKSLDVLDNLDREGKEVPYDDEDDDIDQIDDAEIEDDDDESYTEDEDDEYDEDDEDEDEKPQKKKKK